MNPNLSTEDRNQVGVYLIHNQETDQAYAGSGILSKRFAVHEYLLRTGRHWNYKLQKAFNENPNFEFVSVPMGDKDDEEIRKQALALEQAIIDDYWRTGKLLNIARDVERPMVGFRHSEKAIERNREATTQRWQESEWREKVIQAQRDGKAAMTEEDRRRHGEKVSAGLKQAYAEGVRTSTAGQTRSTEFCKNNSRNITDLWNDPEYRARQMEGRVGKMIGPNKKAVSVDGVVYDSITAAAEAHGLTKQGAKYRFDTDYPNWNYIES